MYIITMNKITYRAESNTGSVLFLCLEGGAPMDKIIIALLGVATVIVQQIFSDDD